MSKLQPLELVLLGASIAIYIPGGTLLIPMHYELALTCS